MTGLHHAWCASAWPPSTLLGKLVAQTCVVLLRLEGGGGCVPTHGGQNGWVVCWQHNGCSFAQWPIVNGRGLGPGARDCSGATGRSDLVLRTVMCVPRGRTCVWEGCLHMVLHGMVVWFCACKLPLAFSCNLNASVDDHSLFHLGRLRVLRDAQVQATPALHSMAG